MAKPRTISKKTGKYITVKGATGNCKFAKRVENGYYNQEIPDKFLNRSQKMKRALLELYGK
jgi:hypothetical protein